MFLHPDPPVLDVNNRVGKLSKRAAFINCQKRMESLQHDDISLRTEGVKSYSEENNSFNSFTNAPSQLPTCDSNTSPVKTERREKSSVKEKNKFHCEICDKNFSAKASLQRHDRIHRGVKPYKCSVCGAEFRQTSGLVSHERTHSKQKPFECSECGKGFAQKGNLQTHLLTHSDNQKPFMCEICGKGWASSFKLKVHTRVHTGEKPFKCSVIILLV